MIFNRSYNYKDVLSRASITLQIIEDVAIYQAKLFSSNGNIFGSNDNSTELTVVVYKGLEDITDSFTDIEWKRFSNDYTDTDWGKQHKGKKTITVTKDDIAERGNIQVEVYMQDYNGDRILAAVDFISFIDINDMTGTPTPPSNPKDGDLWLDTSITPPRLMVWDQSLGMWIEVAIAGRDRRNLLRNSNFYRRNHDFWTPVSSPDLEIESLNAKRWLRMKSATANNNYKGVSQKVSASPKNDYSFQILSQIYTQSNYPNGDMCVAFYSINKNNVKTLLKEEVYDIKETAKVFTSTFTTIADTDSIEVIISGKKGNTFDFIFTNTKLENYKIPTEWELAIEDIQDSLDMKLGNTHEEVFNSLTDDGRMQGIYTDIDDKGNKNFYFNASYIKTGKLLGQYIEAKNLLVVNNNNEETLKIDNNGNIKIKAKELQIIVDSETGEWENAATESDIAYKVDIISTNGNVFTNGNVHTELIAKVYKGYKEITDQLDISKFQWTKILVDGTIDENWNNTHGRHKKSIVVTKQDVYQKSTFTCTVKK